MCESCRHIKDPAKDIFIRTYAAGTQNEYHNEAKARYCPVCGCDLISEESKRDRKDDK